MKSKIIPLSAIGSAAILFAAEAPAKKEASEIEMLKSKIVALEARLDKLQTQVSALSSMPPSVRLLTEPTTVLPQSQESSVPPNVGEIEFNGLKIYKVPLNGSR